MTTEDEAEPVDAELYPDVAEYGGLGAALTAVAAREGAAIGRIVSAGPQRNSILSLVSDRGSVSVILIVNRRVFSIRVVVDDRIWASGGAALLTEVVGVAAAWQGGTTLRQLCDTFPFMKTDPIALGYEASDPLGGYWEANLTDPELTVVRPLLQAARRHPRLSRLFPGVSHLTLVRLRLDDKDRERGDVEIQVKPDGHYVIDSSWSDEPQTADSIDDAIASAAALLPTPPSSLEPS